MRLELQVNENYFIEYKTKYSPRDYQKFMEGFMKFLSKRMIKRVKEVVRRQLFNWHPLSPTWKAYKKELGLSPKIWYASGQTLKALKVWHSSTRKSYMIGIYPKTTLHRRYKKGGIYKTKRTKVRLKDIIRKLEYGTANVPPRPLFVPIFSEFKRDLNKHYADYLKSIL